MERNEELVHLHDEDFVKAMEAIFEPFQGGKRGNHSQVADLRDMMQSAYDMQLVGGITLEEWQSYKKRQSDIMSRFTLPV